MEDGGETKMFGRLFVALIVAVGVILWLDPSVLLDLGIGAVETLFGAAEQAIRSLF